jgi:hypothetical protein
LTVLLLLLLLGRLLAVLQAVVSSAETKLSTIGFKAEDISAAGCLFDCAAVAAVAYLLAAGCGVISCRLRSSVQRVLHV